MNRLVYLAVSQHAVNPGSREQNELESLALFVFC